MEYSSLIALLFYAYYKGYSYARLNIDTIDLSKALSKQFAMSKDIASRINDFTKEEYHAIIDFVAF